MSDFLEESVLLDESQYQQGFEDGYRDGLMHMSGKVEGTGIGLENGFHVGEELGFYQGCVYIWKSVIETDHEAFSARIEKNIEKLESLVLDYPLLDPENENVARMMKNIRLQFRLICANMGVRLDYKGQRISSSEEF